MISVFPLSLKDLVGFVEKVDFSFLTMALLCGLVEQLRHTMTTLWHGYLIFLSLTNEMSVTIQSTIICYLFMVSCAISCILI